MGKKKESTGDEETDAILGEMEEEGEELPFGAGKAEEEAEDDEESADDEPEEKSGKKGKVEKKEEEADDEEEDDESDDDAEDEEDEEEEADGEKAEDEEDEDESDDEADDDDEDEDEEADGEEGEKRTPVWKRLKIEKTKRKAAEALVEELQGSKSQEAAEKKIAEFAKTHKINPEVAKGIVTLAAELAAAQAGLDPATKKALDATLKQGKEAAFWDNQDKQFRADFNSNVAPLAKQDGIKIEELKALRKTIHKIAFKPGNEKKSLVQLYLEAQKAGKVSKKVTSETGRSAGRHSKSVDLDNLDEINELDDEQFDKASEALGAKARPKISRRKEID